MECSRALEINTPEITQKITNEVGGIEHGLKGKLVDAKDLVDLAVQYFNLG